MSVARKERTEAGGRGVGADDDGDDDDDDDDDDAEEEDAEAGEEEEEEEEDDDDESGSMNAATSSMTHVMNTDSHPGDDEAGVHDDGDTGQVRVVSPLVLKRAWEAVSSLCAAVNLRGLREKVGA